MYLHLSPREDREAIKMALGMRLGPKSVSYFSPFPCFPSSRQFLRAAVSCEPFQTFLPPSAEWDSHASQGRMSRLWQGYMVFFWRLRGGKHSCHSTLLGDMPVSQHSLLQKMSQWKLAGSWEGLAASLRWGKEGWLLYGMDGDEVLPAMMAHCKVNALSGWWSMVSFLITPAGLANWFITDRVLWMKGPLIHWGFTLPFARFPFGSVCRWVASWECSSVFCTSFQFSSQTQG